MTDPANPDNNRPAIALLGFGEAAAAIVQGWGAKGPARISAYDIKTDREGAGREAKLADYRAAGVGGCQSAADVAAGAHVILSLVTADRAHEAACAIAPHLGHGTLFLDCNSCAPQTKRKSAAVVEAAGGRYVDVAVMAPVHPRLHRTPMLVSGPHATAALAVLEALDMNAVTAAGAVGTASAIKLCRSIMVKGMEALFAECLLTARRFDAQDQVLASLEASTPEYDWRGKAAYALERMTVHGVRRAAEMRETAAMVADAGLQGRMAAATAGWQDTIGTLDLDCGGGAIEAETSRILSAMGLAC